MSNFIMEATARTPSVIIDYEHKCFEMAGGLIQKMCLPFLHK